LSGGAKPEVLQRLALPTEVQAQLHERYVVHREFPDVCDGASLRAVVTNGSIGLDATGMARLPQLEIVLTFGAGYENVDVAAAHARGIVVAHAPGMNDATVADHAVGMLLALARGYAPLDRAVRAGHWEAARGERPTLNGARLGIIGLGRIGARIAARAAAFDMEVSYHTRSPKAEVPWRHCADPLAMARESHYLVVACPGGVATKHLVNAAVLDALGPQGYLVNIARGSVVDTAALTDALLEGRIAGAGLDVIEDEPAVPPALLACERVLFTPHIAGRSPAAIRAQGDLLLSNLAAHFGGRPLQYAVTA
jgi:D-3-phosphoglycerate dehydrogenase